MLETRGYEVERENQLNQKLFFESLIEGNESQHPIKLLGDLYMAEMQKEVSDLSYIRYAQGEVYFHNHDFEAAIFKWENINNELEAWAKKNIADAYFELQLFPTAEEIYKVVQTDSIVLQTEVLLQLFSLYIEQGNIERACTIIKQAVDLNPDYPDVTVLARAFFEEQKDWNNAIELAVNESVRTKQLSWFNVIQSYVELGYTAGMEPSVFNQALANLYKLDFESFEALTVSMWKTYQDGVLYFSWLKEINYLLLHLEKSKNYLWEELSFLYHDTYFELIDGKYYINEISHLVPMHLANWMKVAKIGHQLIASASVLAWCEVFTSNIDLEIVDEAERIVSNSSQYEESLVDGYKLFKVIRDWGRKNGIELGKRFEWMVAQLLDLEHHQLLVASINSYDKEAFVYPLVGENISSDSFSATVQFIHQDEMEVSEITDESIRKINQTSDIGSNMEATLSWKSNFPILKESALALIDTPTITGRSRFKNGVIPFLHLADSLLFIVDRDAAFSEKELDIVVKIREQAPELPIQFLLNVRDGEQELYDTTVSKISTYFPKAKLFAYSGQVSQLKEITDFIKNNRSIKEERTFKMLHYIRKTIKYLLERRVEIENGYLDSIKWNEDMVSKLTGATNQLADLEEEKTKNIKRNFKKIKDEMKATMIEEIPKLLQSCSEFIREDSDFGKVHITLNEEMNKRAGRYLNDSMMPRIHFAFHNWIAESEAEFEQGQYFLNELSASLNELYGQEALILECDFQVLDDWRRDAERLTRGSVQLDEMNILLRFTPSQFFLKSAGKIFGALQQNKSMLHKKYKQYIENEDYIEIAARLADEFLQPYELFEKTLDRDVNMFFKHPAVFLKEKMKATIETIENSKEELQKMRENPEAYRDPLTLFQVKLLQCEWMTKKGGKVKQYR